MELYSIHYVNVPQWYLILSHVAPPHLFFSVQRMCSLDTFLIILSFILRSPQHLSHGVGGSDGYPPPHQVRWSSQMDIHRHIIRPSVFRSLPAHMDVQGGVHALVCPHLYPYGNYGGIFYGG